MADNLNVHPGAPSDPKLRAKDVLGDSTLYLPISVVGQHVRTYDGVQTLNLTSASQSLTVPGSATHADIQAISTVATDYCRFWDGGGTPGAGTGMTLGPGAPSGAFWESASPGSFKAINSVGAISLSIAYFHYA